MPNRGVKHQYHINHMRNARSFLPISQLCYVTRFGGVLFFYFYTLVFCVNTPIEKCVGFCKGQFPDLCNELWEGRCYFEPKNINMVNN